MQNCSTLTIVHIFEFRYTNYLETGLLWKKIVFVFKLERKKDPLAKTILGTLSMYISIFRRYKHEGLD